MINFMQLTDEHTKMPPKYIFFTDAFQQNIRHIAQLQSDRFEHTLQCYKELFLLYFNQIVICENTENFSSLFIDQNICKINPIFIHIEEIIKIGEEVIETTFNTIINAYKCWLNFDLIQASNHISDLLTKNELTDKTFDPLDIGNHILYRGRISSSYLSSLDMFHIPFNKRYLLGNQRYSLVGHPILYLAFSPLGILLELDVYHRLKNRAHDEAYFKLITDLKISSYVLKPDAEFNRPIFRLINPYFDKTMTYVTIDSNTNKEYIKKKSVSYFTRFIVYNCCSFTKKAKLGFDIYGDSLQQKFVEEYVLPQILAQVLKMNDFGGIIYNSTKNDPSFFVHPSSLYNLALFTTFDSEAMHNRDYVYDKELFQMFDISPPIKFSDYKAFDSLMVGVSNMKQMAIALTLADTSYTGFLIEILSLLNVQEPAFWTSEEGKLQLFLIYNELLKIQQTL